MRQATWAGATLLAFVTAATLTACSSGGGADSYAAQCRVVQAGVPGAGTAAGHGEAKREESATEVRRERGQYVARRLVALSNDFGGASQGDVTLTTQNGSVTSCVAESGGYLIKVTLEARAATEQEARDALAAMNVTHEDALLADSLRLATAVTVPTTGGVTLLDTGNGADNVQRSASIVAGLPARPRYALRHSTSNGDVQASGFSGSEADFDTSNGALGLNGRWDQTTLTTSNGLIEVLGDHAALTARNSNGGIYAHLDTSRSVNANLTSSNGPVEVALRVQGAPGFDLSASTSNGRAQIDVKGTQAVGEQEEDSAHRQTPDYAQRAVKVQVRGSTSNGDVHIHD